MPNQPCELGTSAQRQCGRIKVSHPAVLGLSSTRPLLADRGLDCYGIEVVESHKSVLVQKIKDAIIQMIYIEEQLPTSKISDYLAEKLLHSYGYLANLFSEVTFTSIENFIILQKIERAKHFISTNELTFTEISFRLNYSSLAHFSTQFKNTTGLTPSTFQRIIKKRRQA